MSIDMKIFDAHLHFSNDPYFHQIAKQAGHKNNSEHLKRQFQKNNITGGIVMGNHRSLRLDEHIYPEYLHYCVGLFSKSLLPDQIAKTLVRLKQHFERPNCVGVKFYPGYEPFYISDSCCRPIYEMAAHYQKPVAVHTGALAEDSSLADYSHPLYLGKAAEANPNVQFIMCHLGDPWITEGVDILKKYQNVNADLSGMLVGKIDDMIEFQEENKDFIDNLMDNIKRLDDYERLMYGTDWPLANISNYITFTQMIIPEEHHEKVFYSNAQRIYKISE